MVFREWLPSFQCPPGRNCFIWPSRTRGMMSRWCGTFDDVSWSSKSSPARVARKAGVARDFCGCTSRRQVRARFVQIVGTWARALKSSRVCKCSVLSGHLLIPHHPRPYHISPSGYGRRLRALRAAVIIIVAGEALGSLRSSRHRPRVGVTGGPDSPASGRPFLCDVQLGVVACRRARSFAMTSGRRALPSFLSTRPPPGTFVLRPSVVRVSRRRVSETTPRAPLPPVHLLYLPLLRPPSSRHREHQPRLRHQHAHLSHYHHRRHQHHHVHHLPNHNHNRRHHHCHGQIFRHTLAGFVAP